MLGIYSQMIHLIYISSATRIPSEKDLLELLAQSRSRNIKQNITGLLLYRNGIYMQLLEGNKKDVHEIFASIQKDSINTGVAKLIEEGIIQRDFPAWSMGFKNLESCTPQELPGFVDIFNGNLDKDFMVKNKSDAVEFIMNFAKNA